MTNTQLLMAGVAAIVATLGLLVAIRSRFLRGRLMFSAWLLAAFIGLELVLSYGLGDAQLLSALARLAFVLAIVNLAVALIVNPWKDDRPSDRFPAIVQDVSVIALFGVIATMLMREQLLTTSAVGAVVVGFALQDTLGNLFAGLAIQIEKPFRVGHWIQVASREGQVQEITWRATKLRTRDGEFLIVPNSIMSKEPVLNYSEPTVSNRVNVEVGASYSVPPNDVKRAIYEAIANSALALKQPPPRVVVKGFGASSIDYEALFWVDDYGRHREARDEVRTNLWYTFRRRNIEIPFPTQVQYERQEAPLRTDQQVSAAAEQLGRVDLFATQPLEIRQRLASMARHHLFAVGEAIVRQGDEGDSMFVIVAGRARVALEPSGQEVAIIPAGGFFGEMSMLTGDRRTASVRAVDDSVVLEIAAADFRELALANPRLLEHISEVTAARRTGLDQAREAAAVSPSVEAPQSFLGRMRRFLRV